MRYLPQTAVPTPAGPALKRITFSELVEVFQAICQLSSVQRLDQSSKWDFHLSLPFLESRSLHKHITFPSRNFKTLPLNSERHLHELSNIVIRNLQITLDGRNGLTVRNDWHPLSSAKWHFENCQLESASGSMQSIVFPWRGSFRFYKNEFSFQSRIFGGYWLFNCWVGSGILFQGNDFKRNHLQIGCATSETDQDANDGSHSAWRRLGTVSLVGNKGIQELQVLEGCSSVLLSGMNRIDRLSFLQFSELGQIQDMAVYFGPREKIDPKFHYCMHHRRLFISILQLAATNHDTRQVNILGKQLDRIDYFLNKDQDTPSPADCRIWVEYWQDRVLHAWRRWSSDFYRSWLRPLSMIVLGYMLLNAMPALFIDAFSLSHWLEFTLRPIRDIAGYEEALNQILSSDYDVLSLPNRNLLRLVGLIEVIWIAMWSFAFAKAIRK